jgi:hypothetical protein
VAVSGLNTWVAQTGDNVMRSNQWTHIAYVRTAYGVSNQTIYVNGMAQPLISEAAYAFTNNASDKVLGAGTSGGQFFPGLWTRCASGMSRARKTRFATPCTDP